MKNITISASIKISHLLYRILCIRDLTRKGKTTHDKRTMKYTTALILTWIFTSSSIANETLRHFDVYEVPEAGLIVYKPGSPEWDIDLDIRDGDNLVLLASPKKYFPPTSVEIRLNQKYKIANGDLEDLAIVVSKALRAKTNAPKFFDRSLQLIKYGEIIAYKDDFNVTHQGQELSIRHVIGIMPSGHIITMMAATPKNQIDKIEHMLSKIYSNLIEI